MKLTERILESLTIDDVIELMTEFGVEHKIESNGDVKFQSHCHGSDKFKLYYYEKDGDGEYSPHFHCYSECGGLSVFDTFMSINNWTFEETKLYLARFKGISTVSKKQKGFNKSAKANHDWDFINKYKKIKKREPFKIRKLPSHDKRILQVFDDVYPSSWEDEGITTNAMKKFDIMFYLNEWKAVLPHYDMLGRLIGLRGRSFSYWDIEAGKKYSPLYIEHKSYRHPLQYNLYGLYQNLETIKRVKKVLIVEGEKSVLLCESYYPNENFSVAVCGSNLSKYQRDILLHECEINEVIIGLDKQFKEEFQDEKDEKEYDAYIKKVKKIANQFLNYVDVSIIYCDDDRLDYRDAPTDKGKEILEQLMREKIRYEGEEDEI